MQVSFKPLHPEAIELQDVAERRVRFVLRRLAWLVPSAEVQLSAIPRARGGADKRCHISLRTDGAGSVIVTTMEHDWRTALDKALAHATRYMIRQWSRDQTRRFAAQQRVSGRAEPIKL